jgi:hypothetical protein
MKLNLLRLSKIIKKFRFDRSDLFFWAGGLTICIGVWMIYKPVAVILLGLMFLVIALSETKTRGV